MTYDFDKGGRAVYSLNYHLVQCIKYRRKVLINSKLIDELKERTIKIAEKYEIEIIAQETDKDHIHILFKAKPHTDLVKFVNGWKTGTSKSLQHRYPEIKTKLWNDVFWSPSYCLITTGQVTLDKIKEYVKNQGE
jgi:putative transposase